MSSLFLLDRSAHSVSFTEYPDPSSTIWLEFQMLDLPLLKFGAINNIPAAELICHLKNDIRAALRAIDKADPTVLISSGRACLVHCELIASGEWPGKNVFIDFPDSAWLIPVKALKKQSIFLSTYEDIEKRLTLRPPKKSIEPQEDLASPIGAAQIDDYVQAHFFQS
jgi:hypothetical protein